MAAGLPWVRLGLILAASGAIFGAGWSVESWRASGELEKEQLDRASDIAALKTQWQGKLDAEHKLLESTIAERDAERLANDLARRDAENAYQKTIGKVQADAAAAASDAGRVRGELAAAIAAGRSTSSGSAVQQASAGARCSGESGGAICGLLDRAIDLAARCTASYGAEHAALVEAVAEWPR